jgi:hypothetical protein
MSYQAEAQEIMYRANQALIPTPVNYMAENQRVLSGVNYQHNDYSNKIHDLFRGKVDLLRESYKKPDSTEKDVDKKLANPTTLARLINYRTRKIA